MSHPKVNFNNSPVVQSTYQKHLGLYLDEKLNLSHHIKEKISKPYKGIEVIKKLTVNGLRKTVFENAFCEKFS